MISDRTKLKLESIGLLQVNEKEYDSIDARIILVEDVNGDYWKYEHKISDIAIKSKWLMKLVDHLISSKAIS